MIPGVGGIVELDSKCRSSGEVWTVGENKPWDLRRFNTETRSIEVPNRGYCREAKRLSRLGLGLGRYWPNFKGPL